MMRKLQLHNAAAITMYAIRNGLTDGGRLGVAPELLTPLAVVAEE